jgi:uncharacterized integral membrane protein (TIGR00698 family)
MSDAKAVKPAREMSLIEKNVLGVKIDQFPKIIPGLVVASLLAWLSTWLSEYLGVNVLGFEKTPISAVMMAILLGIIIGNVVTLPTWLKPGFTFSVKKVLRFGIILLGIRLSIFDVFKLGAYGVPIVLLCILGALFFTTRLNKWMKLPERLGALIAVGTSICGVSAIVATGPAIDAEDEEVAYAVAVITIFGIFATLVYPYLANAIFSGPTQVGLFLGTSVHDTSQVTGSALVYSQVFDLPKALDVATVTKLVRNVFMAAVIPFMALYYARRTNSGEQSVGKKASFTKLLPQFVIGFLMLAVIRSLGDALWAGQSWTNVVSFTKTWAVNLLVVALAGVGLTTSFKILKGLGIKPFLVGLGAALIVGVVSFVAISLLGTFVTL